MVAFTVHRSIQQLLLEHLLLVWLLGWLGTGDVAVNKNGDKRQLRDECEVEKTLPKLIWSPRRPQGAKEILRKKNEAEGITHPVSSSTYKAVVIKILWYQNKNRRIG